MSGPNASRQPGIAGNGCVLRGVTRGRSKPPFTITLRRCGGAAVAVAGATVRTTAAKAAPSKRRARGMGSPPICGCRGAEPPEHSAAAARGVTGLADALARTTVPAGCYRIVARRRGFVAGTPGPSPREPEFERDVGELLRLLATGRREVVEVGEHELREVRADLGQPPPDEAEARGATPAPDHEDRRADPGQAGALEAGVTRQHRPERIVADVPGDRPAGRRRRLPGGHQHVAERLGLL